MHILKYVLTIRVRNCFQALDRKELEKKIEVKKIEEERRIAEEKKKLEQERARNLRNIKIIEKKIELTETVS